MIFAAVRRRLASLSAGTHLALAREGVSVRRAGGVPNRRRRMDAGAEAQSQPAVSYHEFKAQGLRSRALECQNPLSLSSKCPLRIQSSQGLGPLFQIKL